MITEEGIQKMVQQELEGSDNYLVSVRVRSGNRIMVFLDNNEGVSVAECVKLSRVIEGKLDRDVEDYELMVSSAGLDQPFSMPRQYIKYVNKRIDILLNDDKRFIAILTEVTDEYLMIKKLTKKGKSKKFEEGPEQKLPFSEIKETKPAIHFG